MGETLSALQAYQGASAAADTDAEDCDFWNLSRVYGQEAVVLYYQNLPDEIAAALDNAKMAAKMAGDTLSEIICFEKKAMVYERHNRLDSMAVAGMAASAMYHDYGRYEMAARALYWVIPYNIANGDYHQARKNIEVYEGQSGYFDENNDIVAGKEHYYTEKGKYYLGIGALDSAAACFRKCIAVRPRLEKGVSLDDLYTVRQGYLGLAKFFGRVGRPDSAAIYALMSDAYNDSIYKYTYTAEAIQLKKLYEQTRLMESEIALKKRISTMNWRLGTALFACLFLAMTIVFLVTHRKWKMKSLAELERRQADNNEILGILREIGKKQSDEMARQSMGETSNAIVDLLQENSDRINKVILMLERSEGVETTGEAQSHLDRGEDKRKSIAAEIMSAGFQPMGRLSAQDWEEIDDFMNANHPQFMKRLKMANSLNQKEYQICLLTMMGLAPSFAAIMMGCSPATFSMSKKRIMEKLTGATGSGKDLLQHLQWMEGDL